MASITTWVRLEPRARDTDLLAGVEARLWDPLWMLARQWQLGELDGVDAGSAVVARTRAQVAPIDAVRGLGGGWSAIAEATPLAVALAPAPDEPVARPALMRRARAGRQLLRLLELAGASHHSAVFVARFAFALADTDRSVLDDDDRRFLAAMIARVPDGDTAAAVLGPLLPDDTSELPAASGLPAETSKVCRAWLAWRAQLEWTSSTPAWRDDQLAYRFEARAAAATEDVSLASARHRGGPVHWYDVDAAPGDHAAREPRALVSTSLPSRVRYRGMPARRYWELEDAAVHWPSIDAGPGDVGRLLFVEFGLTFADHWWVVPLEAPAGALARITSLVVTDCFGVRTLVSSTDDLDGPGSPWHFVELSRRGELAGPLVFVPPAAAPELVGPVLDAVDLVRDDVADVVWAIERVCVGADGRPRELRADVSEPARPRAADAAALAYHLGPNLPDTVQPFRRRAAAPELVLADVPGRAPAGNPFVPRRFGVDVAPVHTLRLLRTAVLTRTSDGRYHLTSERRIAPAPAVPSPAIAFDQLQERP